MSACTTRRISETAAHLIDHVFPRLPVRQWVLSVPERLRCFMKRDGAVLIMVLRIFLRVIAQSLQTYCPGEAKADNATLHIGAVASNHRFGSSLNEQVHFHVCVVDGVFEEVIAEEGAAATSVLAAAAIKSHPASGIVADAIVHVLATQLRRILRAFVGRGLLASFEAEELLTYKHCGFSTAPSRCQRDEVASRPGLSRVCHWVGNTCAQARQAPGLADS